MSVDIRVTKKLRDYELSLDTSLDSEGIHALIGRNGSGKTTILRMVAGLTRPDSGRISVNGRVFFDSDEGIDLPTEMRHTGMMFQNYALFPHMSIIENLSFPLKVKGLKEDDIVEKVRPYLERSSMWDIRKVKVVALSGGQRQRVALMRTLLMEPSIFLLDEPLSALDSDAQSSMRTYLRSMVKASGTPCIVVTHEASDILELGDTACWLDKGAVIKKGKPFDVLSSYDPSYAGDASIWPPASASRVTRNAY